MNLRTLQRNFEADPTKMTLILAVGVLTLAVFTSQQAIDRVDQLHPADYELWKHEIEDRRLREAAQRQHQRDQLLKRVNGEIGRRNDHLQEVRDRVNARWAKPLGEDGHR